MDRPRSAQLGQAPRSPDDTPAWAGIPWWAVALIFAPVYLFAILLGYAFFLTPNSISALWPARGRFANAGRARTGDSRRRHRSRNRRGPRCNQVRRARVEHSVRGRMAGLVAWGSARRRGNRAGDSLLGQSSTGRGCLQEAHHRFSCSSGSSSSENTDLPPEVLFVPKPFSTKMLLACVRQALDDR